MAPPLYLCMCVRVVRAYRKQNAVAHPRSTRDGPMMHPNVTAPPHSTKTHCKRRMSSSMISWSLAALEMSGRTLHGNPIQEPLTWAVAGRAYIITGAAAERCHHAPEFPQLGRHDTAL